MSNEKDLPINHLSPPTNGNGFMTDRGQGNRWHCVTDKFVNAKNLVEHIMDNSWLDKRVRYEQGEQEGSEATEIYCLHYPEEDFSALALLQGKGQKLEFITFYPRLIGDGRLITLRLKNIHPWKNHIEAVLECETLDGEPPQKIYFFDTDYFFCKDYYRKGNIYPFELYALCYTGEVVPHADRVVIFSGSQAKDWLKKNHTEPEYDKDGNIKPIRLRTERAVVYQNDKEYPDFMRFQSPVICSEHFRLMHTEMYRCMLPLYKRSDGKWEILPVFVRQDFLHTGISKGDPLRGMLTLQGRLTRRVNLQPNTARSTSSDFSFGNPGT